jgi:[acyl-carrier-protein] S-malonyltransferase
MVLRPGSTVFLFPGQGSQVVGMGKDLAEVYPVARRIFDEADRILGISLSHLMWEGPEPELNDTINTQPALFVHSVAAQAVFDEEYPDFVPLGLAGHSLGELSALAAGGALGFEAGLRLVRRRGELMKRAGELRPGSMAAILNLDIPVLEGICTESSSADEVVQVANDNCPGQVVISGAKAAVERAVEAAKKAGARRAIPLAVSIAAHSQLMASIQDEWNEAVESANIGDSRVPIVGNVGIDLAQDIQLQMQSRVRWTETIQTATGQGTDTFVEVGTGGVLIGLVRRIAPSAQGVTFGTAADVTSLKQ